MLPANLRSFGGPCACLCASIVGIMVFLSILMLMLLDSDDGPAEVTSPVQVPTMQQPIVIDAGSRHSANDGHLTGMLSDLQRSLQQQDEARQSTEVTMQKRMGRLEQLLATGAAAASVGTAANGGVRDIAAELGVDWGAWYAGAEIDHAFTSWGLGREPSAIGLAGRAARLVAFVAPRYRAYAGNVTHPPEVVLATDDAAPSKCFSFAGNGTIAIRFQRPQQITHVVVEQLPAWATLHPQAAPRLFEVRGWSELEGAEAYRSARGSFEYVEAGPREQVFTLSADLGTVQAVQFAFGRNWGEAHTSVCRLRIFGPRDDAV